jgi:acyl carrier protein
MLRPASTNNRRNHGVTSGEDLTGRIRQVIGEHAHLPVEISAIDDTTDLFQAGMTSHASVNVMLGLEAAFDIEFPDAMLKRSVFQSVSAIRAAISRLTSAAA